MDASNLIKSLPNILQVGGRPHMGPAKERIRCLGSLAIPASEDIRVDAKRGGRTIDRMSPEGGRPCSASADLALVGVSLNPMASVDDDEH